MLTNDISDLGLIVIKCYHKNDEYVKAKAHLVNKNTGMLYETKNYKIHRKVWDRLVSQPI